MADHMRAELVGEALEMALGWCQPGVGLVFHSDRGSRHTSRRLRELPAARGVGQSLSWPGWCWDNAVVEAFYSTLKTELVQRDAWPTRVWARQAIFDDVGAFSNRRRLHSALGYLPRRSTKVVWQRRPPTPHSVPVW